MRMKKGKKCPSQTTSRLYDNGLKKKYKTRTDPFGSQPLNKRMRLDSSMVISKTSAICNKTFFIYYTFFFILVLQRYMYKDIHMLLRILSFFASSPIYFCSKKILSLPFRICKMILIVYHKENINFLAVSKFTIQFFL